MPMIPPETWTLCVAVLTACGYKEPVARSLIGRQLRDYDEADVVRAYTVAAGKADPKAYALGILRRCKTKAERQLALHQVADPVQPASREVARAAIDRAKSTLRNGK